VPCRGEYQLQPVFIEDLAELAVNAAQETRNVELDAVGPEIFTFNELVRLLAGVLGKTARIVHVPPMVALLCTTILGRLMGDVMLTANEIRGLVANLLVSRDPPTAPTRLSDWLGRHVADVGTRYASEFAKRV
jgi:NADH dehydrogenase